MINVLQLHVGNFLLGVHHHGVGGWVGLLIVVRLLGTHDGFDFEHMILEFVDFLGLFTVHMFSGKMLNWAGLLKLAGRGLEGTSFPPSDPQTCI